ncbi:MAG: hypothetical protein ACYCPT_10200 [Acidimicrobiales bacterium]
MAAVEVRDYVEVDELLARPYLHLVTRRDATHPLRRGMSVGQRRARRAIRLRRRQRVLAAAVLLTAVTILVLPGRTFGATTQVGLSTDLATSSVLASGMDYVVQPGDTVSSIARDINPVDPSSARALLIHELGSAVVVPGEHIIIP